VKKKIAQVVENLKKFMPEEMINNPSKFKEFKDISVALMRMNGGHKHTKGEMDEIVSDLSILMFYNPEIIDILLRNGHRRLKGEQHGNDSKNEEERLQESEQSNQEQVKEESYHEGEVCDQES
jgi:hypothetical protein